MVHNRTTNFWNLAAQFFLSSITLASVAFLRLGVDLASTAFVYLIVIVLFALMVVVAFLLNSPIVMGLVRSTRERTEAALQAEASKTRWRMAMHASSPAHVVP